nr:D-2-hydroxyacid dehydrogenase [Amycolatopsis sp. FDAARGOS 1241]
MIVSEFPVLAVLCGSAPPPDMAAIETAAVVRYTDAAGLPEALTGAEALFVYDFLSTAVPGAWHSAGELRWLHIASAGVDPVLFPGLIESDVVLTNSRGVFDDAIAEYVLGVVLAFAKDFARSLDLQRAGTWQHRETERIAGREVLVVGTGPIGRSIARLLRAAGLRVSGAGRRPRTGDPDFGVVHDSAELTRHLPAYDYVVAVAPLTEQTKGMFDAAAFAAMKPSARFVNVGRGELVVTSDLVAALRGGELAGAALDVFDTEPLPADSPLWTMPDVLLSPHMSGDFIGWRSTLVEVFEANFRRWVAGEPLHNVVDKRLGYVPSGSEGATG